MSIGQLKSTWESLGRVDPLWAVLSDPDKRHGQWEVEDFMTTGRGHVDWVEGELHGLELSLGERVLDFGCGVGRLTNALAERVASAVGVDIADSMVQQARRLNRYPERVSFVSYDGKELPFADGDFDSAVSLIVLQHARPRVQLACLLELQRVVRVGGILALQIPSRPKTTEPLDGEAMLADIDIVDAPAELAVSGSATVRALVSNRSAHGWPVGRLVKLGNHWHDSESVVIQDDGRADLPHEVPPGGSVEIELLVTAPPQPGRYRLELDMLQEFVSWWTDHGSSSASVDVEVCADAAGSSVGEPADPQPAPEEPSERPSTMEMHGLDTDLVRSVFAHCGSEVIAVVPDDLAGAGWESFTYIVRRVS